jgi:hypothetical protein
MQVIKTNCKEINGNYQIRRVNNLTTTVRLNKYLMKIFFNLI